MRKHCISLKSKGIFTFLVLLSSGSMAADNLNFNYMRTDAPSLEPQLGLQARACLSKTEPMDIHFQFKPMLTKNIKITLTVDGAPVSKSYAVFSSAAKSINVAGSKNTDPDFQVPWAVSVVGGAVTVVGSGLKPDVGSGHPESYTGEFCFSDGYPGNSGFPGIHNPLLNPSRGYFPLFKSFPRKLLPTYSREFAGINEQFFRDKCGNGQRQIILDAAHRWPLPPPIGLAVPGAVQAKLDVWGAEFLKEGMFFLNYLPAKPDDNVSVQNTYKPGIIQELTKVPGPVTYTFPISHPDSSLSLNQLEKGNVDLRLNNRNISSLSLTLGTSDGSSVAVWEWKADNSSKNKLHLTHKSQYPVKPAGNDNSDIYHINDFYKPEAVNDVNGYYKGTLVSGSLLNQKYKDFVNNIIPLSLPPDIQGDIDLVNTDSLTFIIGQEQDYNGAFVLSVSGKPLKFGPLIIDNKEIMSAMQVRDACY